MLAEMIAGIKTMADGAVGALRATRNGSLVTTNGMGDYTEAASRGAIMEVCTPVAGVAPGTALSTTPPLALWNPPGSNKLLAILKSYVGFISGTLGGGSIVYGVVDAQVTMPTGGTELTPRCSMISFPRGVGRAFQGSTVASTPAILRPAFILGALVNTTALAPDPALDEVKGAIIVPPGTVLVLQGIAAGGTSPLVLLSLIYEEIPL